MLSALYSIPLAQLPVAQAGQLLLVTAIAFGIITLICSTVRFHKLIQFSEDELKTVGDCNDFFFIQVTRYLSKINRASSGFGIVIIQFQSSASDLRPEQEQLLGLLKQTVREEYDKACLFDSDCVAAIIDTEEENVDVAAGQIIRKLKAGISAIPGITALRAGASSFPTHGLTSQNLIDGAAGALEQAPFDAELPLGIAQSPEDAEEEVPEEEVIGELSKKDKNSSIDPLTGVLKADVIASYMRKYLSEIRQKKKPAAVLSVGINRIGSIASLNGEEAADAVIAGVSEIIQRLTRDSDLIGRYGRSEFIILAPCTLEQGNMIAIRLREAVQKETFIFNGRPLKTSISAGISGHPEHGRALRDLFKASNIALDVIRQWGTSACLVYDPAQHNQMKQHEQPAQTRR
jgi:diguanylate cyclase (GGDEF)-like protein